MKKKEGIKKKSIKKEGMKKEGMKKKSPIRKKKFFWMPIAAGFLILYVAVMALSTYLVKGKFMDDFEASLTSRGGQVYQTFLNQNEEEMQYVSGSEEWKNYCSMILSYGFLRGGTKYQQFSGAIYSTDGELVAKSCNMVRGMRGGEVLYFPVDAYLKEEELSQLAGYMAQSWQQADQNNSLSDLRITTAVTEDAAKLKQIIVQKITWEENGKPETDELTESEHSVTVGGTNGDYRNHIYVQTGSETIWQWKNPDIGDDVKAELCEVMPAEGFPYIRYGYEGWKKWMENDFLQNLEYEPEQPVPLLEYNETTSKYKELNKFKEQTSWDYDIYIEGTGEKAYKFVYASDCQPWLAAMDYMKYVYLAGFVLTLVCGGTLAYFTNKTYMQRAALEETRRDFTNAMAHELKTPLGIIRGFAENLEENTVEEKREYYLRQIVVQTEEMDKLVAEMIEVSRLDSESLVLQMDRVSINEIMKEQLEKTEPGIAEKNLRIECQAEADFVTEGDRKYLSRAIGNLLSNAVAYNVQDGIIRINVESARFTIENTGMQIPEEELSRIFEMLHRGTQNQTSRERHLGMGLYLSKRILALHHLKLNVQNTETGVIAIVSK